MVPSRPLDLRLFNLAQAALVTLALLVAHHLIAQNQRPPLSVSDASLTGSC